MALKVMALVSIRPGEETTFLRAARVCIASTRAEAGVLLYDLWQESEGDRRFVFDELYTDQAAFDHHLASDHFKTLVQVVQSIATAAPTIIPTRAIDIAES